MAYVAGVTHALNAVADGLRLSPEFSPSPRQPVLPLPDPAQAPPEVKAVFDEIVGFYALDRPPAVFRWMATSAFSNPTGPRPARPSPIARSTVS